MARDARRSEEILVVDVRLDGNRRFRGNLNDDLRIDPELINTVLSEHPARFAWWATLHEMAKAHRDELKRQLDLLEAKLQSDYRAQNKGEGKERPTDKAIDALVKQDKEYDAMYQQWLDAKRQEGVLNVAREAMSQRKDAMISLAMNLRNQLDGDLGKRLENIYEAQLRKQREMKGGR